jgi:hypothetical protein
VEAPIVRGSGAMSALRGGRYPDRCVNGGPGRGSRTVSAAVASHTYPVATGLVERRAVSFIAERDASWSPRDASSSAAGRLNFLSGGELGSAAPVTSEIDALSIEHLTDGSRGSNCP